MESRPGLSFTWHNQNIMMCQWHIIVLLMMFQNSGLGHNGNIGISLCNLQARVGKLWDIVLASRASGHHLDTQTRKNYPSGH